MRYAVVLLLLVLFVSCASADRHRQIAEDAATLMQQDGVDPAAATPEQWDTYIQAAIEQQRGSWFETILGATFPQLAGVWTLIASVLGLSTGRGRANLKTVIDPNTEWSETFRSLAAVYLGVHSPKVARPDEAAA